MAKRQAKTTRREYEHLLMFIEKHRIVISGKTKPTECFKVRKLWQGFATEMASLGLGPPRTVDKWRKIFNEWKVNVRRKSRDLLVTHTGTDGGPYIGKALTDLEERLLSIISNIHLGDEDVPDTLNNSAEIKADDISTAVVVDPNDYVKLEEEEEEESCVVQHVPHRLNNMFETVEVLLPQKSEENENIIHTPDFKRRKLTNVVESTSRLMQRKMEQRYSINILKSASETFKQAQETNLKTAQKKVDAINNLCRVLQKRNDIELEKLKIYKEEIKIKRAIAKAKYKKVFNSLEGFED